MELTALGYYGKLPVSLEFIRHNASGADIQDLDQWFQQGIHQAKSRLAAAWSVDYEQAGSWHFLYVPDRGARFFTGLVMPGKDAAGREFPFFYFLRVDRASFQGPPWLATLELERVFSGSLHTISSAAAHKDLGQFRSQIDALPIPALDAGSAEKTYLRHAQEQKMGEFWARILGDFSSPAKYYLDHWLSESLKPLSQNPARGLAWGLTFPLLPAAHEETYDVSFWLDLASRHLGYPKQPTLVLWNRRPSKGRPCMMACFGQGVANPVLFMVRPYQEDKTWFDLASEAKARESAETGYSVGRRGILDDPGLTLESFLMKTTPSKV